jgi:hypothetical protein
MLLQQQMWLAAVSLKCPNRNEQSRVPLQCPQYAVTQTQWQGMALCVLGKGKGEAESRDFASPAGDQNQNALVWALDVLRACRLPWRTQGPNRGSWAGAWHWWSRSRSP